MSLQDSGRFGDLLTSPFLSLYSNKRSWPDLFYKVSLLRV